MIELKRAGDQSSTSDPNFSDDKKLSKFLSKLAQDVANVDHADDIYAERLLNGLFKRDFNNKLGDTDRSGSVIDPK